MILFNYTDFNNLNCELYRIGIYKIYHIINIKIKIKFKFVLRDENFLISVTYNT